MYLNTKSGRKIKLLSDEEDARIIAAAENDFDARPWTKKELAKIKLMKRGQPILTKTPRD